MDFPIVEVPVAGGGALIAAVATLHVFLANFVVGGSVYMLVLERRHPDAAPSFAKAVLFVMAVIGSVTGVGIWFAIMGVSPRATAEMIRIFFWPLIAEYACFVVEVVAMAVYVYRWDSPNHRAWGLAVAIASWTSMLIISSFLSFMLTSGAWPQTRALADAVFNPSWLPQFAHRAMASIAVTGAGALIHASLMKDEALRARLTRMASWWVIAPTLAQWAVGGWYLYAVGPSARYWIFGGSITLSMMFAGAIAIAMTAAAYTALQGLWLKRVGTVSAALVALMLFTVIGLMEAVREAGRRPYLIDGYMYSNQITVDEIAVLRRDGALSRSRWIDRTDHPGRAIYRLQCMSCHTEKGFVGMKYSVHGRTVDELDLFLEKQIDRWHPFMPVFAGTADDRRSLAEFLASLGSRQ